jgi:hypothetical protein
MLKTQPKLLIGYLQLNIVLSSSHLKNMKTMREFVPMKK